MPCVADDGTATAGRRRLRHRLIHWMLIHVPSVVLEQSWSFFVKIALAGAGALILLGIVPLPPSVSQGIGWLFAGLWALMLVLGGLLGILGLFRGWWFVEVAGLVFLAAAAGGYALLAFHHFGSVGAFLCFAFGGIAAASLFRVLAVYLVHLVGAHRG